MICKTLRKARRSFFLRIHLDYLFDYLLLQQSRWKRHTAAAMKAYWAKNDDNISIERKSWTELGNCVFAVPYERAAIRTLPCLPWAARARDARKVMPLLLDVTLPF
jgi:hypothetical protein